MGQLLLVDPDHDFSQLCSVLLTQAGHRVDLFPRLPAGVGTDAASYDLILLDPGEDVAAGIAQVRDWAPRTPLLILSGGFVTNHSIAHGSSSPFARCVLLAKPFRIEALFAAVDECLAPAARA